jgi:rod shape-determining protein MreD
MTFLLLLIILLLLAALQVRLPALPVIGLHLEFLPALVAYGALTFRAAGILTLALAAGFIHDALSAGPFGVTALVYAGTAWVLHHFREVFDRDLPVLQIGAGILFPLTGSIAACCFAGFHWSALWKLALLALQSAVITPLLCFAVDYLRYHLRTA